MNDFIIELNEFEPLVLGLSAIMTFLFILRWYSRVFFSWPLNRALAGKVVLTALPVITFCLFFYTLTTVASHDVISDPFYIAFYLLFGFLCMQIGVVCMSAFFNISYADDILNGNNKASLFAFTGGFLGLSIIYAASNIGDGPGWACVLFTIMLGFGSWVILTLIVDYFTDIFDRISIERDLACGIRIGCFLLATGFIMAKKLAGDWDSVHMTLVDFVTTLPALAAIIVEIIFNHGRPAGQPAAYHTPKGRMEEMFFSIVWGIVLIVTTAAGAIKIYG
ncbi:uncharacterized membrane protein YjfL (UPF0719 family) [Elusimicrobium posterum]|uniref:DUF350 domain-containing protein n=1 Tax=Elusimicrobium posterum TaxID=3116653 RepID=UPI003C787933